MGIQILLTSSGVALSRPGILVKVKLAPNTRASETLSAQDNGLSVLDRASKVPRYSLFA